MSLAENLNPRAVVGGNFPPPLSEILADRHADLLTQVETIAVKAGRLPAKVADDDDLGLLGDIVRDARKLQRKIDGVRTTEVEPHLTAQRETNGFFKGFTERLDQISRGLETRATDYQRTKAAEERRVREEVARKAREEEDRQREIAAAEAARNRPGAALKHEDRAEEFSEKAARADVAARASAAELTRVRSGTGTVATTRTSWDFAIEDITKVPLETLRPYLSHDAIDKAIRSYVRVLKGAGKLDGVRIFQDEKASFR